MTLSKRKEIMYLPKTPRRKEAEVLTMARL